MLVAGIDVRDAPDVDQDLGGGVEAGDIGLELPRAAERIRLVARHGCRGQQRGADRCAAEFLDDPVEIRVHCLLPLLLF
ncbi:hypothetical protein ABIF75_007125 [Bradyrhizobium japonicum]